MKSIDKLTKRITGLIDKHPSLGLQGWELHISIVDDVADGGAASCSASKHYDSMWLEFEKKWLRQASDEEIDKVILHELLHAVFRDFDHFVHDGTSQFFGEPHLSVFQEGYVHELEGVVEKLARTLNLASRPDVVQ